MTKRIEDELRELLGTSAEGFDMDGALPPRVRKRARARAVRALSAVVVVAVLGGALSVVTLRGHPAGSGSTAGETTGVTGVRLLSYDDQSPDPVQTGRGWELQLPASIDPNSLAFREAEFVTCALSKFGGWRTPGVLVFGAHTLADVQAFLDCMQGQGFDLPEPTQDANGTYRIDLSGTSIDTSSDAWNRALLITCAPPAPVGPSGPSGGPSGPSGGPSGPSGG